LLNGEVRLGWTPKLRQLVRRGVAVR
jgi:hypothetical protein